MNRFYLILYFLSVGICWSQVKTIECEIYVKNEETNSALGSTEVIFMEDDQIAFKNITGISGKLFFRELEINKEYLIHFKHKGFVTKIASLNTMVENNDQMPPFISVPMTVTLFPEIEGADFSFMQEEPIIKFSIEPFGRLIWDKAHLNEMLLKIQEEKSKFTPLNPNCAINVKKALEYKANNDFVNAIKYYSAANETCTSEKFTAEIKLLNAELKFSKMTFDELVSHADSIYSNTSLKYSGAYPYYERANQLDTGNLHVQSRINEILNLVYGDVRLTDPALGGISVESWNIYTLNMETGYALYELEMYDLALPYFQKAATSISIMHRAGELINLCKRNMGFQNNDFGISFQENCAFVNATFTAGDTTEALLYAQRTRMAYNNKNQGFSKEILALEKEIYGSESRLITPENGDLMYQYSKLMIAAYMSYTRGDLVRSRELYERCSKIRPNDTRPKYFLDKILVEIKEN